MAVGEARARRLVAARSRGVCERCRGARATDWHHRKNRSQGGQWTADNGLHLCGMCHRFITEHPAEARLSGWAVPSWADPAIVPVLLGRGRVQCYLGADGAYLDEPAVVAG